MFVSTIYTYAINVLAKSKARLNGISCVGGVGEYGEIVPQQSLKVRGYLTPKNNRELLEKFIIRATRVIYFDNTRNVDNCIETI